MPLRILLALSLLAPIAQAQQPPPIGIIDYYGLDAVPRARVQAALGLSPGDSFPARFDSIIARLRTIPGVTGASFNTVCCEGDKTILYVGITETGAAPFTWNPTPTGGSRLPPEIRQLGTAFDQALWDALRQGDAAEDRSQGHALMHFPPARAIQDQFPGIANQRLSLLRRVLHTGRDPDDRALAAQIIAYTRDKPSVIPDLVTAGRDPAESVRNSALRALAVMASATPPIKVPPGSFVSMLQSPIWTDRNKASLALMELSRSRDPALMTALRSVRHELVEMAHWQVAGHAIPALIILGRLGGMTEDAINTAVLQHDRETIFRAVQ